MTPELETQKRIIPIFAILAILGIAATIYFFYRNVNFKERLAQQRDVLSEQKSYADSIQASLEKTIHALESKNDSLVQYITHHTEAANNVEHVTMEDIKPLVSQTISKEKTEKLLSRSEKSKYIVGAYTGSSSLDRRIADLLKKNGYFLNQRYDFKSKISSWSLKNGPTVYYYDDAALGHAKEVASLLSKYMKARFSVRKLSVEKGSIKGQERWMLFIYQPPTKAQ